MADKKAKIGAKIELDGEREYKQAIKDIAKEQSVLRSEMKLVASQFADNSKSTQALTETNDVLARQIETQKNKIELLKISTGSSKRGVRRRLHAVAELANPVKQRTGAIK